MLDIAICGMQNNLCDSETASIDKQTQLEPDSLDEETLFLIAHSVAAEPPGCINLRSITSHQTAIEVQIWRQRNTRGPCWLSLSHLLFWTNVVLCTVKAPRYGTMKKGIAFLADLLVVTSRFKRKPCQTAFGVQYRLPSPFPGRHHPTKFETILLVPVRFFSRP